MKLLALTCLMCVIASILYGWFTAWMDRRRQREHQRLLDEYRRNPHDPRWVKDDVMTDDSLPF